MNLLLDLDGTLVDSSSGIYYSFAVACKSLELTPPCYEEFRTKIGPPVDKIVAELYPSLDHSQICLFRNAFRNDYDHHSYRKAHWYPGVISTIRLLTSLDHINMCIITNKPTIPSFNLVSEACLDTSFAMIVGIDYMQIYAGGSLFANKADAIEYVLCNQAFLPSETVYVGDTYSDKQASDRCHITFVAALYGFYRWNISDTPIYLQQFSDILSLCGTVG